MTASRLREILDLLVHKETQLEVQARLDELGQALGEIVSQPQDPTIQNKVAQALERFKVANESLRKSFEPTQILLLEEIGAGSYFVHDFAADIATSIRENPITPAVTQSKVTTYTKQRNRYIQQITQLRDGLKTLGIEPSKLQPGDAEIGFLLPRALFDNQLGELIRELRDINRIIRAFSEATTGEAEKIEVREISASDPLFFFSISPVTIAAMGAAITWALNTWKQVEEIRKVRADIRKTEVLTEKEANEIFDKKITEKITAAIDVKVNELIKDDDKPGRTKEQRTDLRWALESIMAHVERGMIVEVRFLPPPPSIPAGAPDGAGPTIPLEFQTLQTITPQLSFPKMEGPQILKLPPAPSSDSRIP